MLTRLASSADLPAIIALLTDEENVLDPSAVEVTEAHRAAWAAIEADPRNEGLVMVDGDGVVIAYLQVSFIPGLARGGRERALVENVRVRPDRRGGGVGRELMTRAIERARDRGCTLVQLTSHTRRNDAHRFYASLGFTAHHVGFKLEL